MAEGSSNSSGSDPGVLSEDKISCEDCPPQQLYDQLLRTIAIGVQASCMLLTLLLTFLVFRYRKYKAIAGSAWILLELILLGALLLYSMVVVRYFDVSPELCLLEPWLRELGFTCCYGTIVLKIYRLLVEFRTRKAHRWVVREKDLLKYWAVMITCVSVYLASGTISTLQHSEYSLWNLGATGMTSGSQAETSSSPSNIIISNQTRPLFPTAGGKVTTKGDHQQHHQAGGIRVRGDGGAGRVLTSNASSILLQKARILRRDVLDDFVNDTHHHPVGIETGNGSNWMRNAEELVSGSGNTVQWNQSVTCDHSLSTGAEDVPGSNSNLVYVRYHADFGAHFSVCRQLWWHYVNMGGEFLFLLSGLYISSSSRNAASHHGEKLCLFLAIFVEFCASTAYAVLSRIPWVIQHPDHLFMLEFARSQLATSLVLIIIFGPKMFFICRQSSNKDIKRMEHQTSQIESGAGDLLERVQIPADSAIFKSSDIATAAAAGANSQGEMDVLGNVDLSQMDPEVIREELKRVYTQLHVLKMKTLRKDNPHISKRRGGRKPPHRRFSLQRSRVHREKSKSSNRGTFRKPDNVEEPCVDESVCSLDGPTTVTAQQQQQQPQQQQPASQQPPPQPLEPVVTELTDTSIVLTSPANKHLTKF